LTPTISTDKEPHSVERSTRAQGARDIRPAVTMASMRALTEAGDEWLAKLEVMKRLAT
jgi:hypothetical protein